MATFDGNAYPIVHWRQDINRIRARWHDHCASCAEPLDFKTNYATFLYKMLLIEKEFIKEFDEYRDSMRRLVIDYNEGSDVFNLMEIILLRQVEEILIDGEADKALDKDVRDNRANPP